jgi:hypothetical protein
MKKQRQNVRSPKKKINDDVTIDDSELTRAITKHSILVKVINADETVYTDQTGRLPGLAEEVHHSWYTTMSMQITLTPNRNEITRIIK